MVTHHEPTFRDGARVRQIVNVFARLIPGVAMAAGNLVAISSTTGAQRTAPSTSPTTTLLAPTLLAPQGLTVTTTTNGPQLTWQKSAAATAYEVTRATASTPPGVIATLSATTLSYLDRGFNSAATYQVIAVGTDKRTATSTSVTYTPPNTVAVTAASRTPVSSAPAAPTVTSIVSTMRVGDTAIVTGTGFGGLTVASLVTGCTPIAGQCLGPCYNACQPDIKGGDYARLAPFAASTTRFSFVIPQPTLTSGAAGVSTLGNSSFFLTVTNAGGTATGTQLLHIQPRP